MTAVKNTVTKARVLDVMSRLKDAHDHGLPPSLDLAQDARECLAYLYCAVLRHGPGFVVQEDEEEPRLEPPFHVDAEDSFETLADAAQEAEHRHAETGKAVRVYDQGEREAYVSKGPPPEEG